MRKPFISSGRQSRDSGQHDVHTFRIDCEPVPGGESAREQLNEAIEHAHRFARSPLTTVVIDVRAQALPQFVHDAVEHLAGFEVGIVVLYNRQCSLDPENDLPRDLIAAIGRARRDGMVWHPVRNEGVQMLGAEPAPD